MPYYGDIETYFSGEKLYGDDFNESQIADWYRDEEEGYASLGAHDRTSYRYVYHALNSIHGFRYLGGRHFRHALGFGSAYGDEFKPITRSIEHITIMDSSDSFKASVIDDVLVSYVKASSSGDLSFPNNSFDLLTCFGVLHHIPNVTHVVREFYRCLEPNGVALIREPITSMGDWRYPRPGLTRRERGIPYHLFNQMIQKAGFNIKKVSLCMFPVTTQIWRFFGEPAYNSHTATLLDSFLSKVFSWNRSYHRTSLVSKFAPTAAYYVLCK
jgi:SAM-dependent methyltransferase